MKNITLKLKLFVLILIVMSLKGYSQAQYTMSMTATAPTDRTIDVTLSITASDPVGVRFGGYSAGINFNTAIINGGTISATYVANSKDAALSNLTVATPGVATPGQIRLPVQTLTGSNGVDMEQGTTLILGTYKITNSVPWATGSNANLWLQNVLASGRTNSLVNGYPFGLTTPAASYTTTAPVAGALELGYTSASPLSLPLNNSSQDCATLGTAATTAVTCFAGTDGSATITMSALTPSETAITYSVDGGALQNATLVNGAFTISGLAVGSYSVVVSNAGCPDITVPVTVAGPTTPLTNTTNESACDSYTWSVTGLSYTTGGTYTGTSSNGNGCEVNETLNLTITNNPLDYANLQFPSSATFCEGGTLTAYGQVFEAGLTNLPGQAPGITVEFGLNATNTNPATWTNWSPATFNVQVGNNDEYQFTTSNALAAATYYYTFRYVQTGCSAWQYGGYPTGFWNGTSHNSGMLTITPATTNGSVTTSICAGDSYTWPLPEGTGLTYTTAQTDLTNVVGCNTATLNLTITPVTSNGSVTTSICAGDSYTWPANGVTYTTAQSGITFVTGCNTATLNLTINAIDYVNLQFPSTATFCQGGTLTAYGQVYEAGITEAPGQGSGITVEFGLNEANTNPATWTTWSPATFNVQVGNNDEYQFTTNPELVAGTYYYTFRYQLSTCTAWQYGGYPNGFWDGTSQNSGVLTVDALPEVTISGTTSICSGATAVINFSGTPNAIVTYTVLGEPNQTIVLDATGTASITTPSLTASSTYSLVSVTSSGLPGCTKTLSGIATVTITAATTNGSVTTSICAGDSYTWPLPDGTGLNYTTNQTNLTNTVGCNTATLNLTIITSPAPTGSATQTFNVADVNDATIADLVVTPADVIWYASLADAQDGTNALAATTVLTNETTYWAVNVSDGCASTPFAVTVSVALGVDGFDNENFKFYPNPTSDIVKIAYSSEITKVTVMNLLGQVLRENKSNELQVTVDLSSYPTATYLIRVDADANSKIIKVFKKD